MDSIGKIIHNEKKEPKKRNTEVQLSTVLLDNSTTEGITKDSIVNRTKDAEDNRGQDNSTTYNRRQRKHIEIDQYVFSLIDEGLVAMSYKPWHCKVIYTIGLERYNTVVLELRGSIERGKTGHGKRIDNPKAMLAYILKGHMQLHAMHQFTRED